MSHSRSVSGTASVSHACSAPCHSWDAASSHSVTTFCALTADVRNDVANGRRKKTKNKIQLSTFDLSARLYYLGKM